MNPKNAKPPAAISQPRRHGLRAVAAAFNTMLVVGVVLAFFVVALTQSNPESASYTLSGTFLLFCLALINCRVLRMARKGIKPARAFSILFYVGNVLLLIQVAEILLALIPLILRSDLSRVSLSAYFTRVLQIVAGVFVLLCAVFALCGASLRNGTTAKSNAA